MPRDVALIEATVRRTRPVALTALAAVLAFIPLAFDAFWGPLAVVLIGGTAIGTLVTLLFLPALSALVLRIRLQPRQGGDEVAVTPSLGPARATALSPNVGVPEGGVFGT